MAENKGPAINGVCIGLTTLSTVFVLLRLFTRSKIMRQVHLDDYLVVVATICGWLNVAMTVVSVHYGNGQHLDQLNDKQKQAALFWTMLGFPFGIMSFSIPKLAVVALLTRLLNPTRWHSIFLWILSSLCVISLLICVIILYTQCVPVQTLWDFSVKGKCISKWILVDMATFSGALSAFTDLYLAVYPAYVLWGLQMNLRKKIALSVALGVGSVSSGVAMYKCTRLKSMASADFLFDTADLVIWTVVEGTSTIVACCIPVLQPLVEVLFGRRILGDSSNYKSYEYPNDRYVRSADVELSKIGRSGVQHSHITTIGSRTGDPELDSQESILPRDDKGEASRAPNTHGRHITRTDVVMVTYDKRDADGGGDNGEVGRAR